MRARVRFAAVRYVAVLLLATQRWMPPAIMLVGLIAWLWVSPPVTMATVKFVLLALFALAAWLGFAAGAVEDAEKRQIAISTLGSARRLLVAQWLLAGVVAVVFPLTMLFGYAVGGLLLGRPVFTGQQVAAGAAAILVTAAAAAGIGLLVAQFLGGRPGWAAALLGCLSLAQAVPGVPPVGALLGTLPDQGPVRWSGVLVALGAGLAVAAGVLVAAARGWRRGFERPGGVAR